jgi:D-3-phosphoglycerate dehydrogenase
MYIILALDSISAKRLCLFPRSVYNVVSHDGERAFPDASAIVLRSANLHDTSAWLTDSTLALARAGAGTNNIPVADMSERGVVVFNTPGANANSVKELVLATMIMVMRHVPSALKKVDEILVEGGDVLKAAEKAKKAFSGQEIAGKTLGVIGLGQIGVLVANASHDLGMRVVGYDPEISVKSAWRIRDGVTQADSLEELLSEADIVTLHVPFLEDTKHLLGPKKLRLLKPGAIVLNFARNGIVDDDVMLEMLHEGRCRAYVTEFSVSHMKGFRTSFSYRISVRRPANRKNAARRWRFVNFGITWKTATSPTR